MISPRFLRAMTSQLCSFLPNQYVYPIQTRRLDFFGWGIVEWASELSVIRVLNTFQKVNLLVMQSKKTTKYVNQRASEITTVRGVVTQVKRRVLSKSVLMSKLCVKMALLLKRHASSCREFKRPLWPNNVATRSKPKIRIHPSLMKHTHQSLFYQVPP